VAHSAERLVAATDDPQASEDENDVIDWIKREALAIMQREGSAGADVCDAAWRRALETWLHRIGVITVSVDGEVLPCFP
jgi:hypothetical protein